MFSQDDFQEHSQRLNVIIMSKMNKPVLSSFRRLGEYDKKKFNKLLNQYIQSLPAEGWLDILMNDFNDITQEAIFNENFDPSRIYVSNVNTEPQLLSAEE